MAWCQSGSKPLPGTTDDYWSSRMPYFNGLEIIVYSIGVIWVITMCHNERDGISHHQPYDCLLNRLFIRRSKKTSKLRVTGLCVWNSLGTGEFPAQMVSTAEKVSIWWHHDLKQCWPSDAKRQLRSGSAFVQVRAWCLMAPMDQCWLIKNVLWHSSESHFSWIIHKLLHVFRNYTFKISVTFSRGQWVKMSLNFSLTISLCGWWISCVGLNSFRNFECYFSWLCFSFQELI